MPRFQPFLPGVWLMRQLRLPTKLGLLALAIVVPLLVVCVTLVQRITEEIHVIEREIEGAGGIAHLGDLVILVQKHRGR